MDHPYHALDDRQFWRRAVGGAQGEDLSGLAAPKFQLARGDRVATAGSCFGQHIGRILRDSGCTVLDAEPAPRGMSAALARRFGYGLYSARYGNIYTVRQLIELIEEACGLRPVSPVIWERDGRYVDAMRPGVEPDGLDSADEVRLLRQLHLECVAQMLTQTDVFIFTLGLTETWIDRGSARALPVAPGVIAGRYSAESTAFHNATYPEILADLERVRGMLQEIRPGMRMIVTVSPVPLTATATKAHVLRASVYSKATLRAATGDFAEAHADVDYFPSYEIITSPAARSHWFAPNLREISTEGVNRVMAVFRAAHGLGADLSSAGSPIAPPDAEEDNAAQCEERLNDAFGRAE